MKFKLLIVIVACLVMCRIKTDAQATSQTQYFVPMLAPRSPAATAIEKYGTYQVNEFTGVPDISIPLYTVEAGGLQVPITLSYHASGIKVTDVASWAGLGWSISSGGQITRRTMGLPDDCAFGYLNGYMHIPNNNSYNTQPGIDSIEYISNGTYDSRPDIYSYDFPGHGGKFFFDGSATGNNYTPRLMPFAPIKISHTLVAYQATIPPPSTGLTNFSIVDEHGNYYKFGDASTDITTTSSGGGPSLTIASAWKLETMISQNRRDTIGFTYQADQVNYPADDSEIFTVADNINNIFVNGSGGFYTASYSSAPTTPGNFNGVTEQLPKQINFKNGKVVFDLDGSARTDLQGTGSTAYGLADIKIYQYNYGTKAMELQKTIVFYKSYFSANSTTRLRLDSIQVLDKGGSIMQHYRFDYNTSVTLPAYSSFAQDYWGYYNGELSGNPGKTANTMLTPAQTITYSPNSGDTPENVTIGQANRNCDSNYMQAYVLTGIHYPTGGYSTFTYQTNQFYSSGNLLNYGAGSVLTLAGGLRVSTISSYDGVNPTPVVKTYVYSPSTARPNFFLNYAYFEASQTHRYYAGVTQQSNPGLAATETVRTFTSSPHCDLEAYDGATVVYPNVSEYIGTPGNNIGRTDYVFTDQKDALLDASAAGTLVYLSSFYVRGHLLSKKEFINKGSGVYQVVSATANTYTAFAQTDYSNVGLAIKKLNYNEGLEGNPILKGQAPPDDTNSYLVFPYDIISDDNYLTGTTTNVYDTSDTTKYTTSTTSSKYDNLVHQQITRSYHTDSKGNTLVKRTRYPVDYLPSSGSTTTGSMVLDSMINRNMQAEPVESYDTLKNAATSTSAIISAQLNQFKYGIIGGSIVPATISTLSVAQPLTNFTPSAVTSGNLTGDSRYVQMISFDQYDNQNNIIQYTPRNSTPVSILWDYLYENPIAQVKNATTSYGSNTQIAYTSFEANGQGNWSFSGKPTFDPTAPTGTMVYPLSAGNITSPFLPTGTAYVLSYWSNNGAATVYAGSYLTGTPLNTINGWTYYEYQVPSGVTQATISGTTNIDELRLYPAAAQMTTYAYDPSGLRSIADTKGSVNYFEYDYFQRLKNVKDWNGNIVKNYGYHTYDQTIGNDAIATTTFTRNNCPAGTTAQSTTYSVPANRYFSSTKASANAEANYDLNYNGQTMANNPTICGCPIQNISFAVHNNGTASFTLTFTGLSSFSVLPGNSTINVPAGTYATLTVNANDSNTHNITLGTRSPQNGVHNASFSSVVIATGSSDLTLTLQ